MLTDNSPATYTLSDFSRIHECADLPYPPHSAGVHQYNSVAFRNKLTDIIRYPNKLFGWNLSKIVSGVPPDKYLKLLIIPFEPFLERGLIFGFRRRVPSTRE